MAKFVAVKVVERIEWDFEGVPHVGAQDDDRVPKLVGGDHVKGVLAEPSPHTAAMFAEAFEEIVAAALRAKDAQVSRLTMAAGGDVDPLEVGAEVLSTSSAYLAQCEQAHAALRIVDVPEELLEQLPPRYLSAFLTHVAGELQGEGVAA